MKKVLILPEEVHIDDYGTGVRLESQDGELILANICGEVSEQQVKCIVTAINNAYDLGFQHGERNKQYEICKDLGIKGES